MEMRRTPLAEAVIGAAIEIHRAIGPGLFESTYAQCFSHELSLRGISFARQVHIPLVYKDVQLDCSYRADFVVEGAFVVELKAVEALLPVHQAQLLTYVKLLGFSQGLLFNFNEALLKDGLKSVVI